MRRGERVFIWRLERERVKHALNMGPVGWCWPAWSSLTWSRMVSRCSEFVFMRSTLAEASPSAQLSSICSIMATGATLSLSL